MGKVNNFTSSFEGIVNKTEIKTKAKKKQGFKKISDQEVDKLKPECFQVRQFAF